MDNSKQSARNYTIVKDKEELKDAMQCSLCYSIIQEVDNIIYMWNRYNGKWLRNKYVLFDEDKERDYTVTGLKAYQAFYNYCGRNEIERMKHILSPIESWESSEQMHYCNIEFIGIKLYEPIYEFDANSAFTYGVLQLPEGFEPLKEYMLDLYEVKQNANNKITRSKYKNLQNYLIGYFARIKEFVAVRSRIIEESNMNIINRMSTISRHKGIVYLSNTDSIVTNKVGAKIMEDYLGDGIGEFKISKVVDKLVYNSPNAYQLGDKVVYSGVRYFARKHTNLFEYLSARQEGSLIEGYDFMLECEDEYRKLCRVRTSKIEVYVVNQLGEAIKKYTYKIGD